MFDRALCSLALKLMKKVNEIFGACEHSILIDTIITVARMDSH